MQYFLSVPLRRLLAEGVILLFLCATLFGAVPAFAEEDATLNSETTVSEVVGAGDLVKSPEFPAVYYIGEDGERYAFPNEKMYFSWYEDYDEVVDISSEDLAQYALGGNVDYQAGTTLVKLESDPTVYSVEPDGVLRALGSEEQAITLYGENWADDVDDVAPGFWSGYEVGDDLADGELPDGYITYDEETGDYYYVLNGALTLMTDAAREEAARLTDFATTKSEVAELHEDLAALFADAEELSPEAFVARAMTVFVPEDARSNVPPSFALSDEAILAIYAEMIATWEGYAKTYATQYVDTDMDGIADDIEVQQGTDPNDADTDDDGFPDGVEIAYGFNPGHYDDQNESGADGSPWWEDDSAWWKEWDDKALAEGAEGWYEEEMSWTKDDGSVWSTTDGGATWTSDSGETWDWEMSEDVWVNTSDTAIQWEWENEFVWVHEDGSEWYSEDRDDWEDWDGYVWVEGDDGWTTADGAKVWDTNEGYTWEVDDGEVWTSDDGGITWESSSGEVWSYDSSDGEYVTDDGYEWSGDYGTEFDQGDRESYEEYQEDNPTADYDDYISESPSTSGEDTSGSGETWSYDGDSGTWTNGSGETWSGDSGTTTDSGSSWGSDSGSWSGGSESGGSSDGGSWSGGSSDGGASSGDSGSSSGSTSTM